MSKRRAYELPIGRQAPVTPQSAFTCPHCGSPLAVDTSLQVNIVRQGIRKLSDQEYMKLMKQQAAK